MDKYDKAELALTVAAEVMELVSRARGRITSEHTAEEAFHILFEEASRRLDETNQDFDEQMEEKRHIDKR